jgi:hypothetical protein
MAQRRLLFLDEDVPKRLARELSDRGRNAVSIYSEELQGTLDPDLIRLLAGRHGSDVILITANESMPIEHVAVLREFALTVAVIDGMHEDTHQDAWKRETVHRWAHVMEDQDPGTIRRYSPRSQSPWKRRRRKPQMRP